jgi:hypothetical protein
MLVAMYQLTGEKMRTITFNLNCKLEERLRKYTGRKGDLSKVLNEAVEIWLDNREKLEAAKTR